MATLPLPQTNPQGGPNPNSPPVGAGLPTFAGSVDAALTGGAQASAAANARAAPLMPAYDPNGQSLVATPANGVMGNGTGLTNALSAYGAQGTFDDRVTALRSQAPGIPDAIHNWLFNPVGGPAEQAYQQKSAAGAVYSRPEAAGYFSQHPSLLSAAEKDPLGFATKLGPILDAAVAAHTGTPATGVVVHQTPDGPMSKHDANVAQTDAVSKGFGISSQHAHAITQPHQYTRDEFLAATEGLPRGALKNMWEMQHYLNPQQQALSTALTIAQQQAEAGGTDSPAAKEYQRELQIVGGIAPNLNEIQPPIAGR